MHPTTLPADQDTSPCMTPWVPGASCAVRYPGQGTQGCRSTSSPGNVAIEVPESAASDNNGLRGFVIRLYMMCTCTK